MKNKKKKNGKVSLQLCHLPLCNVSLGLAHTTDFTHPGGGTGRCI